ncbi:MAG: hypothetical protein CSA36_02760 [Draconibacterium sp.]|nr:MAG: hypothetical protein CSA36_02760 [Draconibacterium sp.]
MKNLLFIASILVLGFSSGDVSRENITLNWEYPEYNETDSVDNNFPTFQGAAYDPAFTNLPIFSRVFSLENPEQDFVFSLQNMVFEQLKVPLNEALLDSVGAEIVLKTSIQKSGDSRKYHLSFLPFKRTGGQFYLLKSFDLCKNPVTVKSAVEKTVKLKSESESVLRTGKWLKISTTKRGIYKIPFSTLSEWGFSNLENVRVFGAGGTILSENPGTVEFDDLPQNAVWNARNNGQDCLFFYAPGVEEWYYDQHARLFKHRINDYTTKGYFFLTEEVGTEKKVEKYAEIVQQPTHQVSYGDVYEYHEKELENIMREKSGKRWFGEKFRINTSKTVSFDISGVNSEHEIKVLVNCVARSYNNSEMVVLANQNEIGRLNFRRVNTNSETTDYANEKASVFSANAVGNQLDVTLEYGSAGGDENALAWLDYVELNFKKKIATNTSPMFWSDANSVAANSIININIDEVDADTRLFDVTEPQDIKEVPLVVSGNTASAKRPADELREYVLFSNNGVFMEPQLVGEVENQNLHSLNTPELLIISYPGFIAAAQRLADFHRSNDGMEVEVVNVEQVYNEFSSGRPDATGIRNFIKMFYDRNQSLKYVLLLGDGSYDNRNIRGDSKNFIPTFQSRNSLNPISSFVSDDYFVILDEGESVYSGAVDLGIGRIPVATAADANLVVGKIENYHTSQALGEWRNVVCFIADDGDNGLHLSDSEKLADMVNENNKEFITDKIYCDAYPKETTTAGDRYPDVNEAINNRVNKGVLVLNYVGHANNRFLADEHILEVNDINSWSNKFNLPIFVTATCEFSRYDGDEVSAGEYVLLNATGGGVGLFSTTRLVFAYSNALLSQSFYSFVFKRDENGNRYRMGDIIRLAKINTINTTNKRNFSLLGDPALRLSYPKYKVVTTSWNGKATGAVPDTVGALQQIDIRGQVTDYSDNKLNSFNGEIDITVFDKQVVKHTLGNGGTTPMPFNVQENIIYKGKADVVNGDFSVKFIVPKDISYQLGSGKVVYYASNGQEDANGAYTNFVIGGSSGGEISDNEGPVIDLYMDNTNFVSGGQTSKSTTLLALISDQSGINTVGTGIGHDITAVLDNDVANIMVLNNYYNADKGDFTKGTIVFPMSNLTTGKHTLKLKVWDVANNSSEAEIEFEVTGDFKISAVNAYPNPAVEYTSFVFDHNLPEANLEIVIEIFDQAGKRIDYIARQIGSNGNVSNPVRWDFFETGVPLRSGVYLYRVSAKNNEGAVAFRSGKLQIFR